MGFNELWVNRLKPNLDKKRREAEAEYEAQVSEGIAEVDIEAAYNRYRIDILKRGSEEYANKLVDFLADLLPEYLKKIGRSQRPITEGYDLDKGFVVESAAVCPGAICAFRNGSYEVVPFGDMGILVRAGLIRESGYREGGEYGGYTYAILCEG